MEFKLLFIDDGEIRNDLAEFFNDDIINGLTIKTDIAETFEKGVEKIKAQNFDLIVLDLCKGEPSMDADKEGLDVLEEIQAYSFIPVIFYTGIAHAIADLKSEIVGVVNKSDGLVLLRDEIARVMTSNTTFLKTKIHQHVEDELKKYFWDTVHKKRNLFVQNQQDFSLGYLLLRRLSNSLSKENIKLILGDDTIKVDKAHPMEFYIFPPSTSEFESGDIVTSKLNSENYVILTPSCDLIKRPDGSRKAQNILLIKMTKFRTIEDYKKYDELNKKQRSPQEDQQLANIIVRLKDWMKNNKGDKDRFFFLPETPFLEASMVDFQQKLTATYAELEDQYVPLAKLDDPFSQSLLSSFIRYYNRIGFPDLDIEHSFQSIS